MHSKLARLAPPKFFRLFCFCLFLPVYGIMRPGQYPSTLFAPFTQPLPLFSPEKHLENAYHPSSFRTRFWLCWVVVRNEGRSACKFGSPPIRQTIMPKKFSHNTHIATPSGYFIVTAGFSSKYPSVFSMKLSRKGAPEVAMTPAL